MGSMTATSGYTRQRADRDLQYLESEWQEVLQVALDWENWDVVDQEAFQMEWALREDRLHALREWAARGLLTAEQEVRYRRLLALIEKHRPALQRLFAQ